MVFIFLAYFTLYNGLQFHPMRWFFSETEDSNDFEKGYKLTPL